MKIFLISPAFVSVSENLISFTLPVAESRPESRLISVTESPSPVIVKVSLFCINTIDLSPDEITFETDVTVRRSFSSASAPLFSFSIKTMYALSFHKLTNSYYLFIIVVLFSEGLMLFGVIDIGSTSVRLMMTDGEKVEKG